MRHLPHGANGVIRRWILNTAADEGGITSAEVREHFDLKVVTAAGHMVKLRELGYLEADDTEGRGKKGSIRSVITQAGRDYLDRPTRVHMYDDRPLREALGMR